VGGQKNTPVSLLERNETRRVGSTNTGTTVLDGLVGNGELSEVVSNHHRLDLNLLEGLAVVDTDDRTDHLRDNNHVAKVSLDNGGLLQSRSILLGLTELLDQTHGLALETTLETSARTSVDKVHQLLRAEIQELVKVNSAVRELAESSLLPRIEGSIIMVFVSLKKGVGKEEYPLSNAVTLVLYVRGIVIALPKLRAVAVCRGEGGGEVGCCFPERTSGRSTIARATDAFVVDDRFLNPILSC